MSMEMLCQIGREVRELARKLGMKAAALYAKANGIAAEMCVAFIRRPLNVGC